VQHVIVIRHGSWTQFSHSKYETDGRQAFAIRHCSCTRSESHYSMSYMGRAETGDGTNAERRVQWRAE
jgi:hypothetical protein